MAKRFSKAEEKTRLRPLIMGKRSDDDIEQGTMTALMKRMSVSRLPRLQRMKKDVNNGKRLTDHQLNYLSRVYKDANKAMPYIDDHPKYQSVAVKMISLYQDITAQAIDNEKALIEKKAPRIDLPKK